MPEMQSHILMEALKDSASPFGSEMLVDIIYVMRHSQILSCLFLRGYKWHFSHYLVIICIKTMKFATENRTEKKRKVVLGKIRMAKYCMGLLMWETKRGYGE